MKKQHIHTFSTQVTDEQGTRYTANAYGAEQPDGAWNGWLEFSPVDRTKPIIKTNDETSQSNREDLEYWVSGLEPTYLDGALARAQGKLP